MCRTRHVAALAASLTTLSLIGCGGLGGRMRGDNNGSSDSASLPTGCVQGIVIDGLTGERLAFTDPNAKTADAGIHVLVRNQLIAASQLEPTDKPGPLRGEFVACGIPLDGQYPLIAHVSGYQVFESTVAVPSTARSRTDDAEKDITLGLPTQTANIRLYPIANKSPNYVVSVHSSGKGVVGAEVHLQPVGETSISQGDADQFLVPTNTRAAMLTATTDQKGHATFATDDLMLGGRYHLSVLPPNELNAAAVADRNITVGLSLALGDDPFVSFVDLALLAQKLEVQSDPTKSGQNFSPDGSISYYFSRDIQLVPGTEATMDVTLHKAVVAKLVDNYAATAANDKVKVTIVGNMLTLKPELKVKQDLAREPGIYAVFSGIEVRPANGTWLNQKISLAPTVSFFGGQALPAVASTLRAGLGDGQSGSAGVALGQSLSVSVKDQYGDFLPGAKVVFSVVGGGSLGNANATTDSFGNASTTWVLGLSGEQKVQATLANDNKVDFTASLLKPATLTVTSGNNQSAQLGLRLPNPIVLHCVDVNNVKVVNAPVTIKVVDAVNGGLISPSNVTPGATSLTLNTSINGDVTFYWAMGNVLGAYELSLDIGTGRTYPVKATAIVGPANKLVKIDGDAQSGPVSLPLPQKIKLKVVDSVNVAVANVSVQLSTATVPAPGVSGRITVGASSGTTITATTNALGEIEATWTLSSVAGQQQVTAQVVAPAGIQPQAFTATAN